MLFLASFFWDPAPYAFIIPLINHPVLWYSLFFALGFFCAYWVIGKLISIPLEKLSWYLFWGMIVGARLGHVFFYEWDYYSARPWKILYTWEGGLASHGAVLGLLIALLLYWHFYKNTLGGLSFRRLLDSLCIGASFAASCIRIGNFFNQEILGRPTDAWTGVWFGHPADPNAIMPCHPVQLYEALFYLITGITLLLFYKTLKEGRASAIFFISVFSFRFAIEWLKLPQSAWDLTHALSMGQLLSIPFILLGIYFLFDKKYSPSVRPHT